LYARLRKQWEPDYNFLKDSWEVDKGEWNDALRQIGKTSSRDGTMTMNKKQKPLGDHASPRHDKPTPLLSTEGFCRVKNGKGVEPINRILKTSDESNDSSEWFDRFNHHPENDATQTYKDSKLSSSLAPENHQLINGIC
jgi:hypothetical protein